MIRIFNNKSESELLIDDSLDWVQVNPKYYDEHPHITIEFSGFFFLQHTMKCQDCKTFFDSFGFQSDDWFLEYGSNKYLLDMRKVGSNEYGKNRIEDIRSYYFLGTKMRLSLFEMDNEKLEELLNDSIEVENFKNACRYRDLININKEA